jgi:hypothetical protein
MITQRKPLRSFVLVAFLGAVTFGLAGPARSGTLPAAVKRSVARWWHAEGRAGMPKTDVQVVSRAGHRFMQVTIDEADYRGATGNETYLLYLLERGQWRLLFNATGLGYFARRGGPGGHPWVETYAHNSAATAYYQLWGWDNRKRAYVVRKEWDGPYPEQMQFVPPPGGLPPRFRSTAAQ